MDEVQRTDILPEVQADLEVMDAQRAASWRARRRLRRERINREYIAREQRQLDPWADCRDGEVTP